MDGDCLVYHSAVFFLPLNFSPLLDIRHYTTHTHPPHGQPFFLSHYPHFSSANRKTRSSIQIPHRQLFKMSRSLPRRSANWPTAACPKSMFYYLT
ncbi:hypothetical protein TNCV_4349761 [Trichonephila clavipes]|nr:hypothetical protein TNCV_4349761 [Trichonephila clavipes]